MQHPGPLVSKHDFLLEVNARCRSEHVLIGLPSSHRHNSFALINFVIKKVEVVLKNVLNLEVEMLARKGDTIWLVDFIELVVVNPAVASATLPVEKHAQGLSCLDVD